MNVTHSPVRARTVVRAATGLAAAAVIATCLAPTAASAEDVSSTSRFAFTGAAQSYTVPAGTRALEVELDGAAGGTYDTVRGGRGARVRAVLPVRADGAVRPGAELVVMVGGAAADAAYRGPVDRAGGWNGGGAGGQKLESASTAGHNGNGGGGATDLRSPGGALKDRLVVAAGGGGTGFTNRGGDAGQPGKFEYEQADAGGPGTATAGGRGGTWRYAPDQNGTDGSFGQGGTGGARSYDGGGGGGGGWYGGGGGSVAQESSGGGGGSSHIVDTASDVEVGLADAAASMTITAIPDLVTIGAAGPVAARAVDSRGAAVTYATPAATSAVDGDIPVSCLPAAGSLFPVGTTDVTCTATSSVGRTATTAFPVVVDAPLAPPAPVSDKADVKVTVEGPVTVRKGATATWTVVVENRGPATAKSLVTGFSATGLGWVVAEGATAGTVRIAGTTVAGSVWKAARLASGATLRYEVTGTATAASVKSVNVLAGAVSTSPDTAALNNLAARTTRVG